MNSIFPPKRIIPLGSHTMISFLLESNTKPTTCTEYYAVSILTYISSFVNSSPSNI